jgi:type II secretory pathway component GspD/PulD (secretin)
MKAMFGEPKTGGPYLDLDDDGSALRVRGSSEQINEIRKVLAGLATATEPGGAMRVIRVEEGNGITVGEALLELFPKLRDNNLKLITPETGGRRGEAMKEKGGAKGDKARPGVTIVAFSNRLLITTEDREAMAVIVQMVRILVNTEIGSDFEVLRLKHAKAAEVSKILDEAFNGPRAKDGKAGVRVERVRVIADPATNSLLVRARPLDTMTIRRLLERSLDVPAARDGN